MGVSHPPGRRVPQAGCPHAGHAGWLSSRTGIPRGSGDGLPRSPLWQRWWGGSHSWVPLGSPLKITTRNSVSKREELLSVTPRLVLWSRPPRPILHPTMQPVPGWPTPQASGTLCPPRAPQEHRDAIKQMLQHCCRRGVCVLAEGTGMAALPGGL